MSAIFITIENINWNLPYSCSFKLTTHPCANWHYNSIKNYFKCLHFLPKYPHTCIPLVHLSSDFWQTQLPTPLIWYFIFYLSHNIETQVLGFHLVLHSDTSTRQNAMPSQRVTQLHCSIFC